jgi:predicted TIM-barrel fold metal-dependent hydrolase
MGAFVMQARYRLLLAAGVSALVLASTLSARADDVKTTDVNARLKAYADSIPSIDTHSHLHEAFYFKGQAERDFRGDKRKGCGLRRLWGSCYFTWGHRLAPWPKDGRFETWWKVAEADFDNSRARGAYRVMLPIFKDLYGVDFETISTEEAKTLSDRIERNMENPDWADEVLHKKANIEIMVIDAFWRAPHYGDHYPFTVSAVNVQWMLKGFHPSQIRSRSQSPYEFAARNKIEIKSLDDYVGVLDRMLAEAKQRGAVCLKSAIAYQRTLRFDRVPKERAEEAFGKRRKEVNRAQIKAFEDYVFWRLAELSAKHDLPFQIHTGHARIQSSNPMNLVNLIAANPKTKFILFHGGFPWVGETGMIALRYPNVWVDSCWLPTLSPTMAKRAYQEWLDMFSSNRIMWGSDTRTIEGSYGMAVSARRCIVEALAEKVVAKELREEDARRIVRQILRANALAMFPSLRKRVKPWPAEK